MRKANIADLSIAYELTQIIEEPTQVPDTTGQQANLLDLFLASCPDISSAKVLAPIGMSDHSLVSVQIDSKRITSPDLPCHRIVFCYVEADWGSIWSYMMQASSNMLPPKLLS